MKYFFVVFILLFKFSAYSQKESYIYNEKGQLYNDTTFYISKLQYQIWLRAEANLISTLSNIKFPQIYLENNIKTNGKLIISFYCDTMEIKNIVVVSKNADPGYAQAAISGLHEYSKVIFEQLRKKSKKLFSNTNYLGTYYIPYNFMLIDFYEQLKNEKAVPIIKSTMPVIDVGIN